MISPQPSSRARLAAAAPAAVVLLLALFTSPGCRSEGARVTPARAPGAAPTGDGRPAAVPRLEIGDETAVDEAPSPHPQVEPHVVVDPRNPSKLVAAAMSVSAGP